ncbi:MAG: protein-methionine-sulfoxide reductase catalytic subunit MsrP, partial [Phycisphaeraceae bacterium]
MSRTRLRLPKVEPTPESAYLNRRHFLAQMGFVGGAALGAGLGGGLLGSTRPAMAQDDQEVILDEAIIRPGIERPEVLALFPAKRNEKYPLPGGAKKLTPRLPVMTYNNYYEFSTDKLAVWRLARDFKVDPWTIEISGECHKPQTIGIEDLFKIEQEERTYRLRCVEAWSADVPWTGFPLHKLLAKVEPKGSAKYVQFQTVHRPDAMPGQSRNINTRHYPWPYTEGLTIDEAMNELTLGCTGLYGKPLTRQNGGPFRIIVPWKYGYKSPKAIDRIVLTETKPATLWETLQPAEYPFESNVEPDVPHPRWSQAHERVIPTNERRPTLPYN